MERPHASTHYPRSFGEFQAWFPTDADCLDYLEWLRWPRGFVCPSCGHSGGWRLGDGRFMCTGCDSRTSVMAGTIFDRTCTPLTVWFGLLAFCYRQRWDLGAEFEADPGDRLLPDSVGDPSSPAVCADPPRSGAPLREGGGGRNLHRRQRIWTFGRPCQREEDFDVYRD